MFVIFPFETDYFAKLGYRVDYVGNPTAETIDKFLKQNNETNPTPAVSTDKPIIALLSGSRRQEVAKCLPIMTKMATYFPDYKFVVAAAPNIESDFYDRLLTADIEVVYDKTYNVLRQAEAAIVNSGTATLETALLDTPQVIVYHVVGGLIVPLLRKILIKIPFVSLVNLIAQKEAVKELITPNFTEKNLRDELAKIIENPHKIDEIKKDYSRIRKKLGVESASNNTASMIYNFLNDKQTVKQS